MTVPASDGLPPPDLGEPPSKSQRKRTAHAAQDLGEALIGLRHCELEALGLPEALLEAVRDARAIRSRAAAARQRQYIGKLMRGIDPQPIRRALADRNAQSAQEIQRCKRAEAWRQRLIEEGESALDELSRLRPDLDRPHWQRLVGAARRSAAAGTAGAGPAGRELFRALRALLG
jgi:ribosome-associated protein